MPHAWQLYHNGGKVKTQTLEINALLDVTVHTLLISLKLKIYSMYNLHLNNQTFTKPSQK